MVDESSQRAHDIGPMLFYIGERLRRQSSIKSTSGKLLALAGLGERYGMRGAYNWAQACHIIWGGWEEIYLN